jgi:hypothetical protein
MKIRNSLLSAMIAISLGGPVVFSEWPQSAIAATATPLSDVTLDAVSGEGMTAAAAQADAFRNAISQAVGVYVQADTLVQDYVTKSDKIRTSSKGFIKSFQKIK